MPLDKINKTVFHNDNPCAQRGAREYLKFILANKAALLKVKGGEDFYKAARNLSFIIEDLTPKQLSFIDVIYEKTMKGLGLESFSATYKPNNKTNLRYGKSK